MGLANVTVLTVLIADTLLGEPWRDSAGAGASDSATTVWALVCVWLTQ